MGVLRGRRISSVALGVPVRLTGMMTQLWSQAPGGSEEEARRRRLLQMQEEISQGLMDVSDEERAKFLAKVRGRGEGACHGRQTDGLVVL